MGKMLTTKDLFKKTPKLRDLFERFIPIDIELQENYENLCNECTRLSTELYKIEDQLTSFNKENKTELYKSYLIKKEYLTIVQFKLDEFVKYHDIKF